MELGNTIGPCSGPMPQELRRDIAVMGFVST
jgi:hypothetical protein